MHPYLQIIWTILRHSFEQFASIFGIFIIAALVLTLISRWTSNACRQFRFPNFGMYVFGLIGVPVHEFAHALFCKIFFHQVRDVKWFDPHGNGGSHGAVTHEYDPWNLYHRVGHFFIGLGPIILAPLLIGLLFTVLVPGARDVFATSSVVPFSEISQVHPVHLLRGFVHTLISAKAIQSIGYWVFIYLGLCISSQMELSNEDLKQAANGVVPILIVLGLINTVAWLFKLSWHTQLLNAGSMAWRFGLGLMTLTATLAICNLLLCTLVFTIVNRLSGRESVNPFRS